MFISSMARKNSCLRSKSAGDLRKSNQKLATTKTTITNGFKIEDEDDTKELVESMPLSRNSILSGVLVHGLREGLREKESRYRSNSEKTIKPDRNAELPPKADVSACYVVSDSVGNLTPKFDEDISEYDIQELDKYISEYDIHKNFQQTLDHSSRNLSKSFHLHRRGHSEPMQSSSDWYLNPMHRSTRNMLPISTVEKTDPLKAAIIKSARLRDSLTYEENKMNTDYCDFNLRLFRNAEEDIVRNQIRAEFGSVSPYESELYRLRLEKLKLEEAYLLKLKCDKELERTRGPTPKWYELKTKDFTKEMAKYTNVMNNKDSWPELLEYRNQLMEISGEWANLKH